ncbi:uncharacterized protein [Bemisia tabaci]|uniref:uncharacterized protein isoform X2 n=1 Tax=Bemisia tabaci TaxID=7038 RepID=UPI003B28DCD4
MSAGKQYGLIKPKQASQPLKRPSVFDEDSDSNDAPDMSQTDWIKKSYQKEAQKNHQKRAVKTQLDKAMEEDPSVFQYDEVYDDMQSKKVETIKAKKDVEKKPRYIQALLAQAEKRKRENEYRNERLIQKEREAEGEMYKDKETFVTSAYRKKLEEFKKLDEAERRQDMLEEIGDVTKQKDLSGFYRHLYQSTVSSNNSKSAKDEAISPETKNSSRVSGSKSPEMEKEIEESFPLSKNPAKSRHYRKRKSSSSSSSSNEEEAKKRNATRKKASGSKSANSGPANPDADTDISSSSSSSGSSSSSSSSSSESDSESAKVGGKKSNDVRLTSGSEEGEIIESDKKAEKKSSSKTNSVPDEKPRTKLDKTEKTAENVRKSSKSVEKENGAESNVKKVNDVDVENSEDKENQMEEVVKIDIWEKRTVGQVFDDALKRYLERKAARLASQNG